MAPLRVALLDAALAVVLVVVSRFVSAARASSEGL
jgi:hypothetical protein